MRQYRYFQFTSQYEPLKWTQVWCAKTTAELDTYGAMPCEESAKITGLIKILKQKKYKEASEYYYKQFLLPWNTQEIYVRPYKNGILILSTYIGHDYPYYYLLRYYTIDKNGYLNSYENLLYARESNNYGWDFERLMGITVNKVKYVRIPAMTYEFYKKMWYAELPAVSEQEILSKFEVVKRVGAKYSYNDTLKQYKNAIDWFKKLDLAKFLDFNNKAYYILEKPTSSS